MGKLNPRPKNMKLLASTFWQPMSHKMHSPIFKDFPGDSWPVCRRGLDSRSSTSCTCSGSSSSFSNKTFRSDSGKVPHAVPRATARSTKARTVAEKTFVDATPTSAPAMASTTASLSRPTVESASLTSASVRTWPPFSHRRTDRRLSTASKVSPEFETTIKTSPGRTRGCLYLNSDAYCTSTGIRAMCSMRYSPTKAACQEVPHPMIVNLFLTLPLPIEQAAITSNGERPASLCVAGSCFSRLGKVTLPPASALRCACNMLLKTFGVSQMSLSIPALPGCGTRRKACNGACIAVAERSRTG
mmetsp:Transcript_52691/g.162975  ORF Transcript_52691/g.162975 Transcript_52691/m.162975 type:complete len:301 (+) Transcript_52691:522-1424(+)